MVLLLQKLLLLSFKIFDISTLQGNKNYSISKTAIHFYRLFKLYLGENFYDIIF